MIDTASISQMTDQEIRDRLRVLRESWPQGFVSSHPVVKIRKGQVRKIGVPFSVIQERQALAHELFRRGK
jgi:hypothetical protein